MKVLFIGLGSIGQRHLRNLKNLRNDLQIYAYRSSKSVPLLTEENKINHNESCKDFFNLLNEFTSISEALLVDPDLIFICNPSSMHIETLLKVLKSKATIFIEKPLSNNVNNIKEIIINEELKGKKRIFVGYQYRFHPCISKTLDYLEKGILGNIISAFFTHGEYLPDWHKYEDYRNSYASKSELGGGALLTLIHEFDMVINLFSSPRKLFALGGHLSNLEVDVEDSVQILMDCQKYNKYFPVTVTLDYLNWPPKKEFIINGENGNITCNLIENIFTFKNRITKEIQETRFDDFSRNDMFILQMKHFLEISEFKANPKVDLKSAFKSLQISLAAKRSINNEKVEFL